MATEKCKCGHRIELYRKKYIHKRETGNGTQFVCAFYRNGWAKANDHVCGCKNPVPTKSQRVRESKQK